MTTPRSKSEAKRLGLYDYDTGEIMTTRKAIIPCPECTYPLHARICDGGGEGCLLDEPHTVPLHEEHTGAVVIELTREAVSWRHDHPQSPVYPNERSRWVSEWEEGEEE